MWNNILELIRTLCFTTDLLSTNVLVFPVAAPSSHTSYYCHQLIHNFITYPTRHIHIHISVLPQQRTPFSILIMHSIFTNIKHKWRRIRSNPTFRPGYSSILELGHLVDSERFSDADPFKIIYVDPSVINHRVTNLPTTWGRVAGGQWELTEISTGNKWNALEKRFIDGLSWSQIDYQIHDKKTWDTLYESIQKNGYQSQLDLTNDSNNSRWDFEVGVVVDADGSVHYLKRGSHRIRIAKLLDLDKIPVHVRIRHTEWQEVRDEIRNARSVDELSKNARALLDHPDLDDIRNTLET